MDADLLAIQAMRDAVASARAAQQVMAGFSQDQVDAVVDAMARAGEAAAQDLARLAVAETELGVYEDKVVKNLLSTRDLHRAIAGIKTVGVTRHFPETKIYEIAEPMGVVAGLTPVTNPTSTALYKAIIAVKARNAIVLSPHPRAVRCTAQAAAVVAEAAVRAGAPAGLVQCLTQPTLEATQQLMRHPDVAIILATGGSNMVRAAYSSGKPALGVGPGNVPAYIDRTADVARAVGYIVISKTFDNGTVCASEQAVVVDRPVAQQAEAEFRARGAHFLAPDEVAKVSRVLVQRDGSITPAMVGQPAARIAELAGVAVPAGTRLLIAPLEGVGRKYPLSCEKLSPVLAWYVVDGWEAGCHRSIEILRFGGVGHSLAIHAGDDKVIMEFALKKPAFRILANTPSTHGAVGATTGLPPAMTLGCGTWGGSATADNVGPLHLLHIKRLAYGISEPESFRDPAPAPAAGAAVSPDEIASIVRAVLARLNPH